MWELRTTDPDLRAAYTAAGYWNDDDLGGVAERLLTELADREICIWSAARPWRSPLADIHAAARRLAGTLTARGIGPGDVVSFQLPNWVEAAITFYGTALAGAVLVPIVHFYGPREVGYILRQSGSRAHVSVSRFGGLDHLAMLEELRGDLPGLETLAVVPGVGPDGADGRPLPAGAESLVGHQAAAEPAAGARRGIDPDAPGLVAYTSGTTSNPKGVVHSHRSLMAEVRQLSAMNANPRSERPMLTGAPVGHFMGMLGGLLVGLYRGHTIHYTDHWDPERILEIMLEADCSSGSGSTYFLTSLLDDPTFRPEHLERMRFIGLGGSPIPDAVARRATELGISLIRSYGSTELPSTTGARHEDPAEKRLTTDGRAMPGVEIRILDEEGRECLPGAAGEIHARGPELFVGYTDPALTKACIDPDGWWATGDVGVMDADGWLTITDRVKDIVIRGGLNLSPAEMEDVLQRMPGVAEVAVVAAPDPRMGEHACAFVRPRPGAVAPDLAAVQRHFTAAGVPKQKWPEEVREIGEFPRTPSGKIKKFVLRDDLRREAGSA
jgi:acyl-CoA synthetase (AMP-forming)/AMP-acid ligase II